MTTPEPGLLDLTLDGWIEAGQHHYPLTAQFEDTDLSGIVYHGQYINFAERGRSAMLRLCGIDHNLLLAENTAFTVRRLDCAFKAPTRQGERLTVVTGLDKLGGAVMRLHQRLLDPAGGLRADLHVEVAVVHLEKGAMRLPSSIHDRIVAIMC
ncbi:MAG: hotdog domain-containing protein [Candidatus Puniceispirillales bacterium]